MVPDVTRESRLFVSDRTSSTSEEASVALSAADSVVTDTPSAVLPLTSNETAVRRTRPSSNTSPSATSLIKGEGSVKVIADWPKQWPSIVPRLNQGVNRSR